jgi:Protein of unknown function (DUF3309)
LGLLEWDGDHWEVGMSTLGLILIFLLVLLVVGGVAGRGSYGSSAYYGPGLGLVGLVLLVLLILVLVGEISI